MWRPEAEEHEERWLRLLREVLTWVLGYGHNGQGHDRTACCKGLLIGVSAAQQEGSPVMRSAVRCELVLVPGCQLAYQGWRPQRLPACCHVILPVPLPAV